MSFYKKIVSIGMAAAMMASVFACGKESIGETPNGDGIDEITSSELPLNIIDDKYRTTYEIFVYSFADSDGDGIGDLRGITKNLDYIKNLGCNQIWLMPISPSPTYHKYDVTDYCGIDPQYGSLDDFKEFLDACHESGIRVIIDQVYNHSSAEHPWFKEAAEYLRSHPGIDFGGEIPDSALSECRYLDYYVWSNEKLDGFEPVPGTDYFYEARFWSGMPDLNLNSDAVKNEIADITGFWLEQGVDGFRLDAVTYYFTGNDTGNIEFLSWLSDTVKSKNPDAYIVGEAWTSSATYYKYYESGIDSLFDFDYAGPEGTIAGVCRGTTPAYKYGEALEKTEKAIAGTGKQSIDAPFYTNHDMARSAGYYTGKGAQDKVKLAGALNLLMQGNAFIYYGEELGMKGSGKDENKRAPMYWTGDSKAACMCDGPKDMDSFDMKYPPYDEQMNDPNSIYNYFKAAVSLRNAYPAIARGQTTVLSELSGDNICAFTRQYEKESLLIVINTSDEAATLELSGAASEYGNLSYQLNTSDLTCSIQDHSLSLSPYGIAVITR